jgi:hypothetical protein
VATVARQLKYKIELEETVKRELKTVFNKILRDFRVTIAATGLQQDASLYNPVWTALLERHYNRVQRKFKGIIGIATKQMTEDEEDKEELLLLALLAWINQNAPLHSTYLTETTKSNMAAALAQAKDQFAADDKIPTDRELALAATAALRRKFKARVAGIATSETQAAAESTKFIEAEVESGLTPRVIGGPVAITATKKVWRTVGDARVRPIHAAANGQQRSLQEPFVVNGEFLMYPGDSSLGASRNNTINCRCTVVYTF